MRGRVAMSDDLKTFSLELVPHAGKTLSNGVDLHQGKNVRRRVSEPLPLCGRFSVKHTTLRVLFGAPLLAIFALPRGGAV